MKTLAFLWILRLIGGAVVGCVGLAVLNVDLTGLPWWQSILGLMMLSIGFELMPPIFRKVNKA